jgi:23S rRNA (guanosine2251-2'-O)-methyltransferase
MSKQKRPSLPAPNKPHPRATANAPARDTSGSYWIYGWHAVEAALANPERPVRRIIASEAAAPRLQLPRKLPEVQTMPAREMDNLLGRDAVHQGIAALVAPMPTLVLEDVLHRERGTLLVLDQVSDPHNVGAILRSAAAFGALAVITPKDHSAPETAVLAKAACGAVDLVPRISVTNLASALRTLKDEGWWVIGLDGTAKQSLAAIKPGAKTVLILGAEGKGMRRLTVESCDELAKLPMDARMESLNVSNAAAIALYQLYTSRA